MEQDTAEDFILNNIKQEPPVEFVLILPNLEPQTSQNIKSEENEINKMKDFTIRVEKFDRRWRRKPKMFSTNLFGESCKVVTNSKVLKHSTKCDQKNEKDSEVLKLFKCDLCPVKLKVKNKLMKHMICHIKNRSFVCSDCDFGFKTVHGLMRHIRRQKALECGFCKEKFKCQFALIKHEKVHSNNCKCDQCSYIGRNLKLLQKHKWSHVKLFKCETCDKNYARKDRLMTHQKSNKHGDFATAPGSKLCCDKCDYFSLTAQNLILHKKRRHGENDVSCDLCSKVFKNQNYLAIHRRVHVRASCHICNKETNQRDLSQHLKEHFESTEYNCDLCGVKLNRRRTIKRHMARVHPCAEYVCILCRKKFRTIHKLFAHKKMHVGKSDYRCPKCSYKARGMSDIKRHMSMKH